MSREIASYVTLNKDLLKLYKSNNFRDIIADAILTDAILIPQKIEIAQNTNCRRERLRTTSYISIMLRNISSYCNGLEHDGVKEKEYLNLLRGEVITFRRSFKKWRKSLLSDDQL
ncbi:hypothetical protein [Aurantibacter sp.]|uniref:hypothetical protein n=1 Tax=Aurantibacter sp. TaxID=2807103 RepID=UPI003267384B